jgi:hypothetical protein
MNNKFFFIFIISITILNSCKDPIEDEFEEKFPFIVESHYAYFSFWGASNTDCAKVLSLRLIDPKTGKEYYCNVKPNNLNLNNYPLLQTYYVKVKVIDSYFRCLNNLADPSTNYLHFAEVLEIEKK